MQSADATLRFPVQVLTFEFQSCTRPNESTAPAQRRTRDSFGFISGIFFGSASRTGGLSPSCSPYVGAHADLNLRARALRAKSTEEQQDTTLEFFVV